MGYVYVMKAGDYCKIGISDRPVSMRMPNIQTGCPFKIEKIWSSRNIPDAKRCEKKLHEIFKNDKTHGEWFTTPYVKCCIEADKITKEGCYNEELLLENKILKEQIQDLQAQNDHLRQRIKSERWCYL